MLKIKTRRFISIFFVAMLLSVDVPRARAQSNQTGPATQPANGEAPPPVLPTVEEIKNRIQSIEKSADLGETMRGRIRELYEQAIVHLNDADSAQKRLEQFRELRDNAPKRLAEIQKELASPMPAVSAKLADNETLDDAKRYLQEATIALEQSKTAQTAIVTETQTRAARRRSLPDQLILLTERLAKLKPVDPESVGNEPVQLLEAQRAQNTAERIALQKQIDADNMEMVSYEARGSLLAARRELADRQLAIDQKRVDAWKATVSDLTEKELAAERVKAQRALREAVAKDPVLAEIARKNNELLAERTKLVAEVEETDNLKKQIDLRRKEIIEAFDELKRRSELTGGLSTGALGILLRKARDELPDVREIRNRMSVRQDKIEQAQIRLLELENEREEMVDPTELVDQLMNQMFASSSDADREREMRQFLFDLLNTKREYLASLRDVDESYLGKLIDVDSADRGLLRVVENTTGYIDERVLWIRSADSLLAFESGEAVDAAGWLVRPNNWRASGQAVLEDVARSPVAAFTLAMTLIGAFIAAWRSRLFLRRLHRDEAVGADTFRLTIRALLAIVFVALPIPLILWAAGWRLQQPFITDPFCAPVGVGLQKAAGLLWPLLVLRHLMRRNGVGANHFRWKYDRIAPLNRTVKWLVFVLPPMTFIAMALEASGQTAWSNSLGRVAFIVSNIALTISVAIVLRPRTGVLAGIIESKPAGWLSQTRGLWYLAAVAAPVAMGVLAAMGFYYSAMQLQERFYATSLLLLLIVIVNALVRRWLFIERRTIALEQRRKRQQEAAAAEKARESGGSDTPSETAPEPVKDFEVDLYTVNVQTQKLLRTALTVIALFGIWLIWANVLPAVNYLDSVVLWSDGGDAASSDAGGNATLLPTVDSGSNGTAATASDAVAETPSDPITLINLLLMIVILIVTLVAARNLPGLLEILMLQRLPLEPAVRFAITTLVRYAVVIVGVVMAFNAIGIGWSKVQWLAAAITVGLGFGLQEIFANFISGLIILFEQPIRVGDTVTVNDITGTVTRIRTRATTIVNWDRKELIVPNKEFITTQLINWSLSDPIIRWIIPVGIAYGSNTRLAQKLLLKAAKDHPDVLNEPAPGALFLGFGDNSLNLELRIYSDDILKRFTMISELHTAIDDAFAEAGITIAFPQRDVHIDSLSPLQIEIVGDAGKVVPRSSKAGD